MEGDSSRYKRRRSPSSSSSSSSGESDPEEGLSPAPKYHRSTPSSSLPYTCTLPPTCSQPDTVSSYATQAEFERHQDAFHRWICRTPIRNKPRPTEEAAVPESFVSKRGGFNGEVWKECGKVFPDERLLHLHQLETHDPLERARQARGEKIFQCFVPKPSCKKTFMNPTRRRRHLIEKHHYPEQYFFSITNHGINQIVRDDGLAMSLIRPKREPSKPSDDRVPSKSAGGEANVKSPLAQTPVQQDTAEPDSAGNHNETPDTDMHALLENMQSSLMFVPPGLRRKQAAKAKS